MSHAPTSFDILIAEAARATLVGWDFSHLAGRWQEQQPSWDYRAQVLAQLPHSRALLDMGTGGGEFLASLAPLPVDTTATEGYAPNIPVARARLEPLRINVVAVGDDDVLPLPDARFDLVINRHESFSPAEVWRVLQPGGIFLTQQVGGRDNDDLRRWLGDTQPATYAYWNLDYAVGPLIDTGFEIIEQREEFPLTTFHDVGAIIELLHATPWQISYFSVERYRAPLYTLHTHMQAHGPLTTHSHRFFIAARKREQVSGGAGVSDFFSR